jgi:hypothetical protein
MSDLNRRIAIALGWTDIHEGSYWEEDYYDTREVHTLFGTPPGHQDKRPLRDWEHDLNAAMTLIPKGAKFACQNYSHVDNQVYSGKWRWWAWIDGANPFVGMTLSAAICYAFLALNDIDPNPYSKAAYTKWHAAQEAEAHDAHT